MNWVSNVRRGNALLVGMILWYAGLCALYEIEDEDDMQRTLKEFEWEERSEPSSLSHQFRSRCFLVEQDFATFTCPPLLQS